MAFDAFLELKQGGKNVCVGETLDQEFSGKGAMQLTSFTLQSNVDLSTEQDDAATGDKKFFTLKLKKEVDNASPDLFQAYCMHATKKQAKSFDKAVLTVRKAAGTEQMVFLVLEMSQVTVQSYKLENSDADSDAEESFDLAFGALKISYFAQKGSGGAVRIQPGGWDFGNHKQL